MRSSALVFSALSLAIVGTAYRINYMTGGVTISVSAPFSVAKQWSASKFLKPSQITLSVAVTNLHQVQDSWVGKHQA
ncbi:hypothetical protein CIB48_g6638 [Xylaria polymorpha]|nr:hypothetical protein CIB48_g6638 [Xylaria polymorpha]